MSEDALKDLLNSDAETTAPAFDMGFTLDVMARVEKQKLRENLIVLAVSGVLVCLMMAIIMPYLTAPLAHLGRELLPAVVILAALGTLALSWRQMLPGLRMVGLPV